MTDKICGLGFFTNQNRLEDEWTVRHNPKPPTPHN